MNKDILKLNNGNNSVTEFVSYVCQGIPSAVFGVSKSFKNYLVSLIDKPVLLVVKDNITAFTAVKEIGEYSNKRVVFIPQKDEVLLPLRGYSKETAFNRIVALSEGKSADVIVVTAESVLQPFPKEIESLKIDREGEYDLDKIVEKLVLMGYKSVDSVEVKGSFRKRGDLLDVYPINSDLPVRIDFFDSLVESMKKFEPETRKSEGGINSITILSATEYSYSPSLISEVREEIERDIKEADRDQIARLKERKDDFILALENKDYSKIENLFCSTNRGTTVFDYVDEDRVVVFDEGKQTADLMDLYLKEFEIRFDSLRKGGEVFSFQKANMMERDCFTKKVKNHTLSCLQTLSTIIPFFNPLKIVSPQVSGLINYQLDFNQVFVDIENWLKTGYSIKICTGDLRRAERFNLDLSGKGIASSIDKEDQDNGVSITSKRVSSGFIFHEEKKVLIGSDNLFVKPNSITKIKSKKQGFFSAPEIGDYCVHETYGVGKVLGNKKITTLEGTKDYVSVEYQGGDMLYIPVEQMDVLTRYLGSEKHPKLSKIGGTDFERVKRSVKESIKKMSFDLKKLYNERKNAEGYEFFADSELEKEFEKGFPFTETPDQEDADKEIKEEMTRPNVMDRLVCGDVGFGKTEVAFRAVFRAVVNGKQAALLAPTTILTEQHFNTAIKRFEGFGIKIQCLNRFRTKKQQDQIIKMLKEGEIDFIIGTHRLLSKDIGFKDLGLLVLDEEQRFGVEHKEKIKLLKNNVDTITLTATPIPRTLHMSLSGIRSISTINTPPKNRLPVQTYVTEETDALIKDALLREINRKGQAFILYNRVESIEAFAGKIAGLLPDLRIIVTHGQMDEKTLEKNVMKFYNGEGDVLVSTTIIENGIDLPNANTIIVIDADRLGLSTLYQLKGRVGRSDKLAYAYFTFKRDKILTSTAEERLNAIIEFAEMGSGIKIAMRDLEIRGAGNILGAEQHGHMDKIGYELYSKLLKEELTGEEEKIPELDVRLSALIPDDYIESNSARMDSYKEIAEINSFESEKECREFLINSYGAIPTETDNLINIAVVKRLGMMLKAEKIILTREECSIEFNSFNDLSDGRILKTTAEKEWRVRLNMSAKPKLEFSYLEESGREKLIKLRKFLEKSLG